MIVVVDYGMGNLSSVANSALSLGKIVKITDSKEQIKKAKKIIFPGVGHFGRAVKELKKRGIFSLLKSRIKEGVPFLGICLGMQLLFEQSEEAPGVKGLSVLKGKVKKFRGKGLIVPHMGWNRVNLTTYDLRLTTQGLFKGIPDKSYFYFVHSYYCAPKEKVAFALTDYSKEFVSALVKDNVSGVQFHPEKSQSLGLKVYNNFLS